MDPISSKSSTFAFVTYAQAICAWRAVNILNGWVVDKDKNLQIVVKVFVTNFNGLNEVFLSSSSLDGNQGDHNN